jgi:hypothetical protein
LIQRVSKKRLNTKIHLAVDAHGCRSELLSKGTTADCTQAKGLIAGIGAQYLLTDKGYDSNKIIKLA